MSKTIEETVKEIMENEKLREELMASLDEPSQVAEFLTKHGCTHSVHEFIAYLDKYN